jgi:hypothetical protein
MPVIMSPVTPSLTPVPFATSPQAALIDDHTKQQLVESFAVVSGTNSPHRIPYFGIVMGLV